MDYLRISELHWIVIFIKGCLEFRWLFSSKLTLLFIPFLPELVYETVKNNTGNDFYDLSDLCAIRKGPHPLINMENYIPYEGSILLTKHQKILQDHTQLTHCEVKKGGWLYFYNHLENIRVFIHL